LGEVRSDPSHGGVRVALLAVCLCLPAANATARNLPPDSASTPQSRPATIPATVAGDLRTTVDDVLGFFTAPLRYGKADWNRTAAGIGALGIVMGMDEPLNALLVSHPGRGFLEDPLDWAKEWGRLRTMQYASLGLYFGGLLAGNDGIRVTGRLMGEALLLAGTPAITLQYGLGRSRPHEGTGAYRYNFFEWGNEFQSLPSGHATVAFAISAVLAKRIGRTWAGIPLYSFAGLTALAMAWGNEHWPSDVLLGSAIGYLAGSYVVSREEERRAGGSTGGDEGSHGERGTRRFGWGIGPRGLTLTCVIF